MRVYLPSTLSALAELARTGELGAVSLHGYAVTGALRDAYSESDDEELEYFATTLAAEDSFTLAAATASPSARRVVVAAELPDAQVTAAAEPLGAVTLAGPVPRSAIAAFHVDDPEFKLDAGDPEAAADQELLWYAAQELGDLVEP
jgi:hypothetical protein